VPFVHPGPNMGLDQYNTFARPEIPVYENPKFRLKNLISRRFNEILLLSSCMIFVSLIAIESIFFLNMTNP